MSVLVKGMEMPWEEAEPLRIELYADGTVIVIKEQDDFYEFKAVPVPPHGRLVDEEQPIKNIEDAIENIDSDFPLLDFNSRYCMERGLRMAKLFVKDATTIIPAEEEA